MPHKRILLPEHFASGELLTSDLVAIGMRLAAPTAIHETNIEDTLLAASLEGICRDDFRVLALLVDWVGIHFERVNADRLTKLVMHQSDRRVRAFWTALAQWQSQDWRFKKLQSLHRGPRLELMEGSSQFQISKYGEDARFEKTALRIPAKLLRHRPSDILSPTQLAQRNPNYYFRTIVGPSYRADMWALLEATSGAINPAELARRTYGSFPTAWQVKRDWITLHPQQHLTAVS